MNSTMTSINQFVLLLAWKDSKKYKVTGNIAKSVLDALSV